MTSAGPAGPGNKKRHFPDGEWRFLLAEELGSGLLRNDVLEQLATAWFSGAVRDPILHAHPNRAHALRKDAL